MSGQRGRGGGDRGRGGSPQRGRGRGGKDDGQAGRPPPGPSGQQLPYHGGPPRGRGDGPRGGYGGGGPRGGFVPRGGRGGAPSGAVDDGPPPGIYQQNAAIPQPDRSITAAEDALVELTRGKSIDGFPGRRSFGSNGRNIILRTNYFKINTPYDPTPAANVPPQGLFKYDVSLSPEVSKKPRQRLIRHILETLPFFQGKTWATDLSGIIITTDNVDLGPTKVGEQEMVIPPRNEETEVSQGEVPDFVQAARKRNTVTVRITLSKEYSLQEIMGYLKDPTLRPMSEDHENIIQLLNIIICKEPKMKNNVVNVGNNKFYPFADNPMKTAYALGGGLEALRGFYSSVRPAINRLLLNVNVSSGAFYTAVPLIQLLNDAGLKMRLGDAEDFIRGLSVKAEYTKDGNVTMTKFKTIAGFARELDPPTFRVPRFGNANDVHFKYYDRSLPNAPERDTTVAEYFLRERGMKLNIPIAPVLNVGTPKDPQYLPMEICTVLPGQPHRRFLGGVQTSSIINFAARRPNQNAISIAGTPTDPGTGLKLFGLGGAENTQLSTVKKFGFSVGTEMLTVPGRILITPRVEYSGKTVNPSGGSWNLNKQRFHVPGTIGNWKVLVIDAGQRTALRDQRTEGRTPDDLITELANTIGRYGIRTGRREATQRIRLADLNIRNRAQNDAMIRQAFQNADAQGVRMMMIVLPEADKWLYARIKYYGDVKFGIHSINAVGQKLQKIKGEEMFMGNLALKFNIKGGGVSHKVPNTLAKPLDNETMLMGIDVTHPSPGSSEGAPSISAVVASIDEHLSQWPGSVRTQKGRQEMVDGLEEMVLERLDTWRKRHNKLPTKIVLYRDGVSEPQCKDVLTEELPSFEAAFAKRYGNQRNWPKMAIIVVGKRHHTRFYPTKAEDSDRTFNPLPGTVVDRGIAGRVLAEFWLQAHQGLQGTARPAHYVVIKDDIHIEANELERITHNMCYLFNRATKAVSICPPAYYADLLCERGRAYLYTTLAENNAGARYNSDQAEWARGVHERLKDSTWYI